MATGISLRPPKFRGMSTPFATPAACWRLRAAGDGAIRRIDLTEFFADGTVRLARCLGAAA
jgi:hypothetical protein